MTKLTEIYTNRLVPQCPKVTHFSYSWPVFTRSQHIICPLSTRKLRKGIYLAYRENGSPVGHWGTTPIFLLRR